MSSPREVLLSMEGLASHLIRELLEVRRAQRAEAEQRAAQAQADEKRRIKQESKAKIKAEAKMKAEATMAVKAEPTDAAAAAASSLAAAASSAPKATSRPRQRRSTARRTIIIQYQPTEKNCTRDERGVLQISGSSASSSSQASSQGSSQPISPVKREESDGGAASGAAAASPSTLSRWSATLVVKLSGRKKKGSNGSSKPKRARSATGGSQVDDSSQQSVSGSQDDEALSQWSFGEGSQEAERDDDEDQEEEDRLREGAGRVRVRSRQIIYPSRNGHRQLASLVTHLSATYLQIQNRSHANIRELWYDDKSLFRSKSYSDSSLKLLCAVLAVPRHALQLVGTAKGLIVGDLQFELEDFAEDHLGDGSAAAPLGFQLCDCSAGHPIPPHMHQIRGMSCGATWLLLVEKDTVYSKLMQAGFPQLQGCLLVTGKGMPDFATCNFLHLLSARFPALPLFGLFDCDPDGIGIFAEYKYGNAKTAQHKTALPRLQLLGLTIADAIKAGVWKKAKLPLTSRDQARIRNMLASEIGQKDPTIRAELQSISELSHKAEIECLSQAGPDYLVSTYLLEKKAQLEAATRQREAQTTPAAAASSASFEAPSSPSPSSISSTGISVKSEWSGLASNETSSAAGRQADFGLSFDSDQDDPFAEDAMDAADTELEMAPETVGSIGSTLNDDSPWLL